MAFLETPQNGTKRRLGVRGGMSSLRCGAAAVLALGGGACAIGYVATSAARAALVPNARVIVRTISEVHGEPVTGTRVTVPRHDRRVFVSARDGIAFIYLHDELMPTRTTDGGRIWRIDGPGLFSAGAADSALTVDDFDAASASTFYAYGGGQVVDITSDGGKIWHQVIFQGLESGVSPVDHGLAAYVDESNNTGRQGTTIQFYSTNGGRSWRVVNGENFSREGVAWLSER